MWKICAKWRRTKHSDIFEISDWLVLISTEFQVLIFKFTCFPTLLVPEVCWIRAVMLRCLVAEKDALCMSTNLDQWKITIKGRCIQNGQFQVQISWLCKVSCNTRFELIYDHFNLSNNFYAKYRQKRYMIGDHWVEREHEITVEGDRSVQMPLKTNFNVFTHWNEKRRKIGFSQKHFMRAKNIGTN